MRSVERTLEFYALNASNDTIDDFREGHDRAYDRGAELNLVTEQTARQLIVAIHSLLKASPSRRTVSCSR